MGGEKMDLDGRSARVLVDAPVNVKLKLAGLWASVMFIFLYADYFGLYIPGQIENIIAGKVAGFQINQGWLLGVMILMTIPSLMVFLSLVLKAKANRITNIIVGVLKAVVVIAAVIGDSNYFYLFASSVELVLLSLIVWYAWKWPKQEVIPTNEIKREM
jgi:hypothetical protein